MSSQSDSHRRPEDTASEPATSAERPATPVVGLVGRTRQEETRLAVATAASLSEQGVSPSDIVIATADVDQYEDGLTRAAARYGCTVAVWRPLQLKRTVPYRLVSATLRLLAVRGQRPVAIETLTEPLTLGWVSPRDEPEPLAPAAIQEVSRRHAGVAQSIPEWQATIATAALDRPQKRSWMAYVNWIAAQPDAPTSKDVTDALEPMLDRYDATHLPETPGERAVSELAATLRGRERTTELVTMTRRRYARWLAAGRTERRWRVVNELLESFATAVPGRRELPTAAAIDVMEANDLWALSVPYVIAVGLVAGAWPSTPASPVPSVARTIIEDSDIDGVRPHSAWTTARDRDQFAAAHNTATTALVVTRHEMAADGVENRPSRFLEETQLTHMSNEAQNRLMADPSVLPEPLRDCLPTEEHDGR